MADKMFRPPIHRGMRNLDRSQFVKKIPLKAARVFDNKNISKVRLELTRSRDALQQERLGSVFPDPDPERARVGTKCILLRPEVRMDVQSTNSNETQRKCKTEGMGSEDEADGKAWPHSKILAELVKQEVVAVIPYDLVLDYKYWTYHDIISALLPEDEQGEIPSGFSLVGHVAHLNLRDEYVKYKYLIAEILLDKNPNVRTVINKIDDVGEESEYRTFRYEVLAGPDDLNVTVSEENCIFKFDYSKVYWNSRLNTEHRRLVSIFKEGEAVCDVMAGIGPFAVPAGKKGVFVWANDLNPDSYTSLVEAIKRNKVTDYVRAFQQDGRAFIRLATAGLAQTEHHVDIMSKKDSRKDVNGRPKVLKTLKQPKTFQHYILNLPASAITFLSSFVGLYPASLQHHLPAHFDMPIVHVYCFSTKSDDNVCESIKICKEISGQLGYEMKPGRVEDEGGVDVFDVRDVAPNKRMFCASFRVPTEVAFREK